MLRNARPIDHLTAMRQQRLGARKQDVSPLPLSLFLPTDERRADNWIVTVISSLSPGAKRNASSHVSLSAVAGEEDFRAREKENETVCASIDGFSSPNPQLANEARAQSDHFAPCKNFNFSITIETVRIVKCCTDNQISLAYLPESISKMNALSLSIWLTYYTCVHT